MPKINQHGETRRQRHPDRAPGKRLAKADGMDTAVEDPQIEGQHHHHKEVEKDPEEQVIQWFPSSRTSSHAASTRILEEPGQSRLAGDIENWHPGRHTVESTRLC